MFLGARGPQTKEGKMPRLAKEQTTQTAPEVNAKPSQKRDWLATIRLEECKPFTSNNELPDDDEVIEKVKVDAGGNKTHTRTIKKGEPRFYMEQSPRGWYSLIAVFRKGNAVGKFNMRTLKPRDVSRLHPDTNPVLLNRAREDSRAFEVLKKNKIPIVATPVSV